MGCELGCNPDYRVLITDRCAGSTLMEVEFSELKWGRVLDGISEAQVTVPAGCCGKLADIEPWRHELHIIRDGAEQWTGPITTEPDCRSGVTIVANDMLAWLGVRVVRKAICHDPDCGGTPATGPEIAERIIRDAIEPDDPCLLEYLKVVPGGLPQEREYKAYSAYAYDALTDLAKGGVDFTAVGRQIVVFPEAGTLGELALLTCDHFLGDVCATKDGGSLATRAVVTGKAPDNETVVTGFAGGVDPYYGLVERLLNDDTIKTTAAANVQAQGLIRNPVPLLIQPPRGNGLDPNAPVCMDELIPGVQMPVSLDCTCRDVTQAMRLVKLDVTVNVDGEKVAPMLSPVGLG
jgi:hypothetical protein